MFYLFFIKVDLEIKGNIFNKYIQIKNITMMLFNNVIQLHDDLREEIQSKK